MKCVVYFLLTWFTFSDFSGMCQPHRLPKWQSMCITEVCRSMPWELTLCIFSTMFSRWAWSSVFLPFWWTWWSYCGMSCHRLLQQWWMSSRTQLYKPKVSRSLPDYSMWHRSPLHQRESQLHMLLPSGAPWPSYSGLPSTDYCMCSGQGLWTRFSVCAWYVHWSL